MKISIIAAMTKDLIIGAGNKLPWKIPEELQYFKLVTSNKPIIMGGNTFVSINQKPLPNRFNIVLTRDLKKFNNQPEMVVAKDLSFASNINESLSLARDFYLDKKTDIEPEEIMIIGGREIYKQFLPLANKLYISIIKDNYVGDILFPTYDRSLWKLNSSCEYEKFIAQTWERY